MGHSVRVRVPEADRDKMNNRNIIAIIISLETESLKKLSTKPCTLNQLYFRNKFSVCKKKFILIYKVSKVGMA